MKRPIPDRQWRIGDDDAHYDPFSDSEAIARGALGANSERALRADLAIWRAWCTDNEVPTMPAHAETIAAFVDAVSGTRVPVTVRRYVASVAFVQRALGHAETTRREPVRRALKRMHQRNEWRESQATGITWTLREAMLDAAGNKLIDARNRALLAVAYDTLLRRSELVALEVRDIVAEARGAATVLVRRSKTDRDGRGATLYLARDRLALVDVWVERSGVHEGKGFHSFPRSMLGDSLDAAHVGQIFKRMARAAGMSADIVHRISAHSTRVGATQDMIAGGIAMPAILDAGRWKTTAMVQRYGERVLARRSGAAQLARLQHRE